jgi:hypothetical protein
MKPRTSVITLGLSDLVAAIRFHELGLGLPRLPFEGEYGWGRKTSSDEIRAAP